MSIWSQSPRRSHLPSETVSLGLVVPLYNEEARFPRSAPALIRLVRAYGPKSEVIWVDDGSTDRTHELVGAFLAGNSAIPGRLIRRPHRGKGAAVQTGIEASRAGVIGFCDVDLATSLADVERLITEAIELPVVAIGSRALPASNILVHEHALRELMGRLFNRAVRGFACPDIRDTQCGAKFAAREVWHRVLPHCRERGFSWDVEVLAIARALGIGIRELPVTWTHDERTRVRVLRDGVEMAASLMRIRRRAKEVASNPDSFEENGFGVLVDNSPPAQ